MTDAETILRREFSAEEGSFLLQLRVELVWDREAFSRLTKAMLDYVRTLEDRESLPRWAAEGFWYLSGVVRDWSTHANFPRRHPEAYYQAACERLDLLADWLFTGVCPLENGADFEPI